MSVPASARGAGRGLRLLGARRGAGTRPGGRRAQPQQVLGSGVPARSPGSSDGALPGGPSSGRPGQRVQPGAGAAAFLTRSLAGARAAGAALASACLIHRQPPRTPASPASPPVARSKVGGRPSLLSLGCEGWLEGLGGGLSISLLGWAAGCQRGMGMLTAPAAGWGWRRVGPPSTVPPSPLSPGWLAGASPSHPWRVPHVPSLSPAGPRMSSMFGKPRAGGERPPQSPLAECNVAILGCRGAGKSGETGAAGTAGCRGAGAVGGRPPHPPLPPPAALTVKFLTKRFISEYDPNLGKTLPPRVFPPRLSSTEHPSRLPRFPRIRHLRGGKKKTTTQNEMKNSGRAGFDPKPPVQTEVTAVLSPRASPTGDCQLPASPRRS